MSSLPQPAWSDDEGADRATSLFRRRFDGEPDGVWASPGRVNMIGEHVDYNGGLCLPIALPHRTFVALRRRSDQRVSLVSDLSPEDVWSGGLASIIPGGVTGWVAYAAGPAWALAQDGFAIQGFEAAIASCVPLGAGLSSSAAIECAVALALAELFGSESIDREQLVRACIRTENEVAGANTGGLDQAASLHAEAGHALLLDCRDRTSQQVPFDLAGAGLELLVVDTRAPHSLNDGQYAERRATCEAAAALLGVPSLREVTDLPGARADPLNETERRRVRHVVTEIARVEEFVELTRGGHLHEVGPLMDASHESLRVDYEVTCAELDVAVEAARAAGALGARMTGGGFGGSVIALVEGGMLASVAGAIEEAFAEHGFRSPVHLTARAAAAGSRIR